MTLPASDRTPTLRARAVALGAGALLLGGLAAPAAQAAGCQGAPGSSAVEQYCEAIPSGNGGRSQASSGKKSTKSSTLSEKTNTELASAGRDGAGVARLADDGTAAEASTDDSGSSGKGSGSSSGKKSAGDGEVKGTTASGIVGPKDASGSPLRAATEAAQAGSTVGPALAWGVVGMSAFGAIAAVALRRRKGTIVPPGDES